MRILYAFLFLLFSSLVFADNLQLKTRFQNAHIGDFIVTQQDQTYSLLLIRDLVANTLILEEVAIPVELLDTQAIQWQQWLDDKAPGHTAWTLYEIDLLTGELLECYSYSKRGWLQRDENQQFLSKLLTLGLAKLGDGERRKIGPPPSAHESDHRSLWNPPLVIDGKKAKKPQFDVWHATWPDDNTPMAGCHLELYFNAQNRAFPFPHWIELQGVHYNFKIRTVEAGSALHSPFPGSIPHRAPQFLAPSKKDASSLHLKIKSPSYYKKLHLFAIDLTNASTLPIPFHLEAQDAAKEELELCIALKELQLIGGHRYQWALVPAEEGHVYVESDEIFTWK